LALLSVLIAVVAGCAGSHKAKPAVPTTGALGSPVSRKCSSAGEGLRTCVTDGARRPDPTIERRRGSSWFVVTGSLKPADPATAWLPKVYLSPDRRTLLAEWGYACDGHAAAFVPAGGGKARIVTGERSWLGAVGSRPLGWTRRGTARVRVFARWGPRRAQPPGVYEFDPHRRALGSTVRARGC